MVISYLQSLHLAMEYSFGLQILHFATMKLLVCVNFYCTFCSSMLQIVSPWVSVKYFKVVQTSELMM